MIFKLQYHRLRQSLMGSSYTGGQQATICPQNFDWASRSTLEPHPEHNAKLLYHAKSKRISEDDVRFELKVTQSSEVTSILNEIHMNRAAD